MYPGYNPYDAMLSPARRSAVVMWVLGCMAILFGVCSGFMGFMFANVEQFPPESQQQVHIAEQQLQSKYPGVSPAALLGVAAFLTLGIGLTLVISGFFVRRGGRGAAIFGLWVAIPMIMYLVLNLLKGISGGGLEAGSAVVMMALPIALSAMLVRWLFQAARNAGRLQQLQSQYQAQYYQYQQQAAAYGQGQPSTPQQQPYPSQGAYGGGYGGGQGGGYSAPPQSGFVPGQGTQWQQPNWPLQQPPAPPQTPHQPNPPPGQA
jgi:hypothetical protein